MGRLWMNAAHVGQKPFVPVPITLGPLAARSFFCFLLSTRGPMNPRKAGNRVRAANIVNSTPMAAAMANP